MKPRWLWWFGAAALACLALPWVVNPGAGLSLNPVDLAEWTTLHPAFQSQPLPLLTPLLLRTPLLLIALLLALSVGGHPRRWWATVPIAFLAVGQLPPFEFLADSGSANYRQQLLMAVLTLAVPVLVLWRLQPRHGRTAAVVVLIAGVVAAVLGTASALGELRALGLPAQLGPGLIGYGLILATAALLTVLPGAGIKKRRAKTPPSVTA